jgi:type I restriction enzyme S subunit
VKVPEGWELTRIREAASVITGTTPSTKDPDNYGDEYLFVSPGDLGNGKYINATEKKLSVKGFRQSRSIRKGSTLFTCIGSTIGKVGVAGQELATNQQINAVICDRDKADDEYAYYALDFRAPKIKLLAGTQAVPIINKSTFENQKLLLPPLPEQRKIAEILGTWDEAIALIERRIEAARQRKKGLMQRLLTGQVRFPEFVQSRELCQTKLGKVPVDWQVVRIQNVAKVNTETLGSNSDPEHEYLYIELSAVDQGVITMPIERQQFADLPSRARRVLHKGDVIMATVRPNLLGFAVCDFEPQDVLCSTGFALLSPKNVPDSQFIYQSLYGDTVLGQVYGLATGSNYPAINTSEVKRLKLSWPRSKEERKKIAAVLQACDLEIELRTQKRDALKRQKKGLMQRLLTGRVRVEV